jgi:hypothetical protein
LEVLFAPFRLKREGVIAKIIPELADGLNLVPEL